MTKGDTVYLDGYDNNSILLGTEPKFIEHKIATISYGNKIIISFEKIADRTELEKYLPFSISMPKSKVPKLDEGEFYYFELIGYEVVNSDNDVLGIVKDFYFNGAQEVLKYISNGGSGEIREVLMIPNFVLEISHDTKSITIVEPEFV